MGKRHMVFMGWLLASFNTYAIGSDWKTVDRPALERMLAELEQRHAHLQTALKTVEAASVNNDVRNTLHGLAPQIEAHHALVHRLAREHGVADDGYAEDVR